MNEMNLTLTLPAEQVAALKAVQDFSERIFGALNQQVWLTEKEAGERFKVDRQTIARWRKEGWLRYIKAPGEKGCIRYKAEWLDADVIKKLGVVATRW